MPSNPLHRLRLKPVELLRRPGSEQRIVDSFAPTDLDVDDARVNGDIEVAISATSTIDGILVGGTIDVPFIDHCKRCATAVTGIVTAQLEELYQFDVTDDEAIVIDGSFIELGPVVRQYALLELADGRLCRDDCAGLCPNCGIDHNEGSCDCDVARRDPRWAALENLSLENE